MRLILLVSLWCFCQSSFSQKYKDGTLLPVVVDYGDGVERQAMAEVQGKYLILEGDIIISTIKNFTEKSAAILSNSFGVWPNSTIPYTIDPSLTDLNRITLAVNHINDNTNLCLIPRASETNYVKFTPSSGCSSWIGRIGGEQDINLSSGCQWIETVHEILHAAGFYHEQSRTDRDTYVTILTSNILNGFTGNFNKYNSGQDIGSYDYNSIMHYRHNFFGCVECNGIKYCDPQNLPCNNVLSTMTKPNGDINFGPDYVNGMTSTDILGVNTLYPNSIACGCTVEFTGSNFLCSGTSGNLVLNISNAVGPFNVTYSDGSNNFTVNGYGSGNNIPVNPSSNTTYTIVSIIDTGDNNRECISNDTHTIEVLSDPGTAFSNGSNSAVVLSCESVNSISFDANSADLKDNGYLVGWFFSNSDPSSTTSNSGITNLINNAVNSSNLNLTNGNVIQSNTGNPLTSLNNLSINCNTLKGQGGDDEYFITPFVAIGNVNQNCSITDNNISFNWSNGAGGAKITIDPPLCSVSGFTLEDVNIVLTVNSCSGASSTIGGDIIFNCGGSTSISSPFDFTFDCSGSTTVTLTKAMLDAEKGSSYDPVNDQVCLTFINSSFSGAMNLNITAVMTAVYSKVDALARWNSNGGPIINADAGQCFWGTPIQLNCDCGIPGCTNPMANNYNSEATSDDGSCTYDCTSTTSTINSGNVNTNVLTSMDNLNSTGNLTLSVDTAMYLAKNSIQLNQEFTVNQGSVLYVNIDTCQ